MPRKRPADPKFGPLLQYPLLTRNLAIQCMSPMQLVNYSFSSKNAAQAVRDARIRVDLMEIYLYGGRKWNSDPQHEQGIELTFSGCSGNPVLFWFKNTVPKSQVFHKKVTYTGFTLKKCFTKSYNDRKNLVCITKDNELVNHLKHVEAHFRSVFRIEKTDIDLNGDLIEEYKRYWDVKNPKVVNKLRVNTEVEPDMEGQLRAFNPSYLQLDLIRLPSQPIKITADVLEYAVSRGDFHFLHLLHLDAKQVVIANWVNAEEVHRYFRWWYRKDSGLEKLEVFKCTVDPGRGSAEFSSAFNPQRFDGIRRPGTKKIINRDGNEQEIDLRNGVDIRRSDGKLATIHVEELQNGGTRFAHFWFVVWPAN